MLISSDRSLKLKLTITHCRRKLVLDRPEPVKVFRNPVVSLSSVQPVRGHVVQFLLLDQSSYANDKDHDASFSGQSGLLPSGGLVPGFPVGNYDQDVSYRALVALCLGKHRLSDDLQSVRRASAAARVVRRECVQDVVLVVVVVQMEDDAWFVGERHQADTRLVT